MASYNFKSPVVLEAIANSRLKPFVSYEPTLFPGVIYHVTFPHGKVVALIFGSGKVVFTGAKTRQDLFFAWRFIYGVMRQFRRPTYDDLPLRFYKRVPLIVEQLELAFGIMQPRFEELIEIMHAAHLRNESPYLQNQLYDKCGLQLISDLVDSLAPIQHVLSVLKSAPLLLFLLRFFIRHQWRALDPKRVHQVDAEQLYGKLQLFVHYISEQAIKRPARNPWTRLAQVASFLSGRNFQDIQNDYISSSSSFSIHHSLSTPTRARIAKERDSSPHRSRQANHPEHTPPLSVLYIVVTIYLGMFAP